MAENNAVNRLLDEAIDLVIRLQDDRGNPVMQATINRWRARSSRHEEIWQKVSGAHGLSGQVLKQKDKAARKASTKVTRRKFLIGGLAGIGASSAGALMLPDMLISARADHVTAKGELARLSLLEGTQSTLGPDTAIALDFARDRRRVDLLKGMAYFDVPARGEQPFTVAAGGLTVSTTDAAFDISDDADLVNVSVKSGTLQVSQSVDLGARNTTLKTGDWLRYDAGAADHMFARGHTDPQQVAAWRNGIVVANEEPISALVAKVARWYPGRIVILDPAVANQRVSGIFDLNDTRVALEAIVHPAGARVRDLSRYLTVVSPI